MGDKIEKLMKKNKPKASKATKTPKRRKADDTIEDDEEPKEVPSKEPPMSKEPTTGGVRDFLKESVKKLTSREPKNVKMKSKEKDKDKTSREKKTLPSAEKTERETGGSTKIILACRGFCKYLLDMKESSLSTYFDERLAKYAPPSQTFVEWEKNMSKNRSKEYKMNDSGRVHIDVAGKDSYINASHIKFDSSCQEYILTQYPLKETIHDFWRMVSQKRVSRIITMFEPFSDEAIEEFNKIPSTVSPAPTSTPDSVSTGTPVSVSQKSQTRDQIIGTSIRCETTQIKSFFPLFTDHYMNLDNWLINTRKVEVDERNKHWMNMYTVEIVAAECSEANYIRVFNCTTWPWKKVPNEEKKLLALARAPYKDSGSLIAKADKSEPIVVMCDLGLDRSATVILTSVIIELVLAGKTPDCDALFKKMRDQRSNVFTMSMFFTYAIRAALVYLRMKLKLVNDPMSEEVKAMINEALAKVPFISNPKK
ncbi:unnamed protein product [Caenorhabditis nigoni]|uniref:Tyrosine-protein phosphatase domain-containing protein n=1 Tax=Caenorhabditis nigoni TaxID=1611254 RepID=A0A2G5UFL9_9PELO|nr:hypothetical protein B9Z55_010394 [Caenorhabditis nigoni]